MRLSVKPILSRSCALLLLAAMAGPALAENARLPYHRLYGIQKAQEQWNRAHTNLIVVTVMRSTEPSVQVGDVTAFLDAKSGKIPVTIGAAGEFTIPLRDDLLAEDPWLITNQPKGTMKLSWQTGLRPGLIARSIHYARLMQPVRDSGEIQRQMRQYFPDSPQLAITGLKLIFPSTQKGAMAIIHSHDGERKLRADDQGEIIIPLVAELMDEDPEITLPETPGAVALVSHPAQ